MKKFIRNFIIFIILIILTFILLFKNQDMNKIVNIILSVKIEYILIGILCMFIYFILESLNIKNILNELGDKVKLFNSFKYTLIGFFFSGITPAASGGQPMEIYFMHKDNIKVSNSTIALLVELISFQVITILFGIIGAIINYRMLKNGFIYLFIIGISLNIIALTTMLVCLFSRDLAKGLVDIFLKILKFLRFKNLIFLNDFVKSAI